MTILSSLLESLRIRLYSVVIFLESRAYCVDDNNMLTSLSLNSQFHYFEDKAHQPQYLKAQLFNGILKAYKQ